MLAMFRRGLFYTYLSIYLRNFLQLSVTETTLYATLPMIMSVLFQNLIWGPLSDKFNKRRTLIVLGEILAGLGTMIVWLIHFSFDNLYVAGYVIILGLSCVEMFWSMSNIGWTALLSDLYPYEKRSKIMGNLTSLGGLGRIFGISIGGFLYDSGYGFRNGPLFFVASLVMIVSAVPMLFVPEGGTKSSSHESIQVVNEEENSGANNGTLMIFIIFIVALMFINFGRNSIAIPYSQYLTLESGFHVDDITLSLIVNFRSLANMIIGVVAGKISKKLGEYNTLILGCVFAISALLMTGYAPNLIFIFVGSFLIGTAEVIIMTSSYTIASEIIPADKRGKLFAVYNTTLFLSWGLACTLISGPIIDILITEGVIDLVAYQISFVVGSIITSIGLFIVIIMYIIISLQKKQ